MAEPARWGLRRSVLDVLDTLHLARPIVRSYELALAARSKLGRRDAAANGLPLPPARLRAQAGPAHADAAYFLRSGERHAELITTLLHEQRASIEGLEAILDFGCGCGRVIRHWSRLPGTRIFGCDINPKMIEWCGANLGFADVRATDISPPLPYDDAVFDLVYAFSVFTHLPEDLQRLWIRELTRVCKPGGYILISTLGEHYLSLGRLTVPERRSFVDGGLVVLYQGSPGTSLCSAYHPRDYVVRDLAAELDSVAFLPAADDAHHDIYLFRKSPDR